MLNDSVSNYKNYPSIPIQKRGKDRIIEFCLIPTVISIIKHENLILYDNHNFRSDQKNNFKAKKKHFSVMIETI